MLKEGSPQALHSRFFQGSGRSGPELPAQPAHPGAGAGRRSGCGRAKRGAMRQLGGARGQGASGHRCERSELQEFRQRARRPEPSRSVCQGLPGVVAAAFVGWGPGDQGLSGAPERTPTVEPGGCPSPGWWCECPPPGLPRSRGWLVQVGAGSAGDLWNTAEAEAGEVGPA